MSLIGIQTLSTPGQTYQCNPANTYSGFVVNAAGISILSSVSGTPAPVVIQTANGLGITTNPGSDGLTVTDLDIKGYSGGDDDASTALDLFDCANSTFLRCAFHDAAWTVKTGRAPGLTLNKCDVYHNHSTSVSHSEGISSGGQDNVTIEYCRFWNVNGTGDIVILGRDASVARNWRVFGNVFFADPADPVNQAGTGHGVFAIINGRELVDSLFANNTVWNLLGARVDFSSGSDAGKATNVAVRDNIWEDCGSIKTDLPGVAYSNNVFSGNSSSTKSQFGDQVTITKLLKAPTSRDFSLLSQTLSATSPWTDRLGVLGSSRGWLNFSASTPVPDPPPPTSVPYYLVGKKDWLGHYPLTLKNGAVAPAQNDQLVQK